MDAEKLRAVRELQQHFPALTVSDARHLLEKSNWNLSLARQSAEAHESNEVDQANHKTDTYFVGGGGAHGSGQQVLAPPSNSNRSPNSSNNKNEQDMKTIMEKFFAMVNAKHTNSNSANNTESHKERNNCHDTINFNNVHNSDNNNNHDESNEELQQEQGNWSNMMNNLGAHEECEQSAPHAFFGRGRRLGFTTNPSPFMSSTLRQRREVNVSVYKNGFHVNDEFFIPLTTDDGAAFVHALENGYVPEVLAERYPDTDIDMKLKDMQENQFTSPTSFAFSGTGHRLTNNNTNINTNTTTTATSVSASAQPSSTFTDQRANSNSENVHTEKETTSACYNSSRMFSFNSDEPSTSIRIVTTHGKQSEVKLNAQRHTVEDLYYLAHTIQPELDHFVLSVRERPLRTLTSETRTFTIADAKLERSVVQIQSCT